MIANALLLVWALGWAGLFHHLQGGLRDREDFAAMGCLVVFPAICVLAARFLP